MFSLDQIKASLSDVVKPEFKWPEIPLGWQLEFIVYSNEDVDMDLLHPVSGVFWSEDNGHFQPPIMNNGKNITAAALKKANVPFMTTFCEAKVSEQPKESHLKIVK